jgi:hypothetical protein
MLKVLDEPSSDETASPWTVGLRHCLEHEGVLSPLPYTTAMTLRFNAFPTMPMSMLLLSLMIAWQSGR